MNKLLATLSLGLVAACANQPSPSSAVASASATQAPAAAGELALAPIQSIVPGTPANGEIVVTVSYWLHCAASFDHLEQKAIGPISLANPQLAIGVWTTPPNFLCLAADQLKTATFTVPNIVGIYTFSTLADAGKAYMLTFQEQTDDANQLSVTLENTQGDAVQDLATLDCQDDGSGTKTCGNGQYRVSWTGSAATLSFVDQPLTDVSMSCQAQSIQNDGLQPVALCKP